MTSICTFLGTFLNFWVCRRDRVLFIMTYVDLINNTLHSNNGWYDKAHNPCTDIPVTWAWSVTGRKNTFFFNPRHISPTYLCGEVNAWHIVPVCKARGKRMHRLRRAVKAVMSVCGKAHWLPVLHTGAVGWRERRKTKCDVPADCRSRSVIILNVELHGRSRHVAREAIRVAYSASDLQRQAVWTPEHMQSNWMLSVGKVCPRISGCECVCVCSSGTLNTHPHTIQTNMVFTSIFIVKKYTDIQSEWEIVWQWFINEAAALVTITMFVSRPIIGWRLQQCSNKAMAPSPPDTLLYPWHG